MKSDQTDEGGWSDEELRASVIAYVDMRERIAAGEKVVKKRVYESLSEQFGRSVKAYEFRMQNISHVLDQADRPWIAGLKPKQNVGAGVTPRIERFLLEVDA